MTQPQSNAAGHSGSSRRPVRSKTMQWILIGSGIVFVALGVVGIFLPVMPTTIFLLLAAACFVRSSDRLHHWLQNHRVLGTYLRAVEGKSGMPRRAKITTLVVLWISILCSAFIFVDRLWLQVLLLAIACGVSVFVLSRKTMDSDTARAQKAAQDNDNSDRPGIAACRETGCT